MRQRRRSLRDPDIAITDPAYAQCGEPGPGLEPRRAAVGRPEGEGRSADEILGRDHADAPLVGGESAVEAVVAIVAHQEQVTWRHTRLGEIISGPAVDLVE